MADTAVMPITARQALEQWNAGKDVPAFQAEGDPERQQQIYAAAFAMIGGGFSLTQDLAELILLVPGAEKLSEREFHTAHSIAYVAMKVGWARMVGEHIHPQSPAMTIKKA